NNGILSGNPSYASQCTQCEECLDKCPQELAIPDLLEDVVQDMEGKGFNEITAKVKKTLTNT
ncbi:MAG: aldo/keto reductase, partial [Deltaproteobacteria bacterium]|nr:aldo/keto reductase [Deltaproteobacteria bacterium]